MFTASLMTRKCLMEVMGTFFLSVAVMFSMGSNPMIIGLMLMIVFYAGVHISGAHYNPAVTVAVMTKGGIKVQEGMMYMASQVAGALLAGGLTMVLADGAVFTPEVAAGTPLLRAVFMEMLFTFLLCYTILTITSSMYKNSAVHGVVVGLTLIVVATFEGLYNPAIAISSMALNMVKAQDMANVAEMATYLGGPFIGGALAAVAFCFFNPKEMK